MNNSMESVEQEELQEIFDEEPVSAPKKFYKKPWVIISVSVGIFFLCSVLCIGLFATGLFKVFLEKAPVEAVLDEYMLAMLSSDVDGAYALFSPRAQNQMNISDLEELTKNNNFVLFEGYKQLTVQNINISLAANTNSNSPQGTVAKVDGIITYRDGFIGHFNAVLEDVDDEWKIFGIRITVPPNKFPSN